jgi:lysophospholipase L1-like esterase
MVRFRDAEAAADVLADAVSKLPSADKVIVISAGDLGTARIFPPPLRHLYSSINRAYHRSFADVTNSQGVTYVDLSRGPGAERFAEDPAQYFADDNFHLSSEGYGLWFEAVQGHLPTR